MPDASDTFRLGLDDNDRPEPSYPGDGRRDGQPDLIPTPTAPCQAGHTHISAFEAETCNRDSGHAPQPVEVAAFLAQCPIIGPGPALSALPSAGYAVACVGNDTDPVLAISQRVTADPTYAPSGWSGTPARWYVRTLAAGPAPGRAGLWIDFGGGWGLPDADAAAVFALADRIASGLGLHADADRY